MNIKNFFIPLIFFVICGCVSYEFEKEIKIPDDCLFTNFEECNKFFYGEEKPIAIIGYRSDVDRYGHPFFLRGFSILG